jgi:hypothetical protein
VVPGAFARAAVELESVKGVPTLPDKALVEIDDEYYAYVISGGGDFGKAERVKVKLGLRGQEHSQIVEGLELGAQVVADVDDITDGMELKRFGAPDPEPAAPEGGGGKDPRAQGKGKGKGKTGGRGKPG